MRIIISLIFALFLFTNFQQPGLDRELQLLKETDKNWAEAFEAKDLNRILSFYDEEAYFVQDPPVWGKDKLRKFWEDFFALPDYTLTWHVEDARISKKGDLAYTSGPWLQQFTQNGKTNKSTGRYLAVWRKQKDGTWKVLADKP